MALIHAKGAEFVFFFVCEEVLVPVVIFVFRGQDLKYPP